ncbi:hypothetical protein BZL43_05220 [Pseudomonas sp. PICF141]|nr:hypothetical protein BZL43_05220 [Pseudomonas sp. PICF141]
MESEHYVLTFLKRFRYLILALMVIASLVNAFVRFAGDWSHFWGVLAAHAWFTQAVFAYLRGGWVAIGPGGFVQRCESLGESGTGCNRICVLLADIYL